MLLNADGVSLSANSANDQSDPTLLGIFEWIAEFETLGAVGNISDLLAPSFRVSMHREILDLPLFLPCITWLRIILRVLGLSSSTPVDTMNGIGRST